MIDSISLAKTLDEKYFGKEMPVKFRIAVASCPNSCVSERLNEVGITGVVKPYRIPGTCTGCGTCVEYCKERAIAIKNGQIQMDNDRCVHCGMCIHSCPFHIIKADPPAYHITIGGRRGRHPRIGYHLVTVKTPETVVTIIDRSSNGSTAKHGATHCYLINSTPLTLKHSKKNSLQACLPMRSSPTIKTRKKKSKKRLSLQTTDKT
jgi:dissimilatory sulfite reductase (desulfoviridin) alpha/beta subunit